MARRAYAPDDSLTSLPAALPSATLLDFWKWGFSDLCDDDVKGFFAEWLVLKLLNIPSARRISWGNNDIITPEGVRIEVKSSSFWQSWKLIDELGSLRPSPLHPITPNRQITFSRLKARDSVDVPNTALPKLFKSHLYVFAFQREQDPDLWDAMDLNQWEFNILRAKQLEEFGWASVTRRRLHLLQRPLSASEFVPLAQALINNVTHELNVGSPSNSLTGSVS